MEGIKQTAVKFG